MRQILYAILLIALTGSVQAEMRTWTTSDGQTFEAEYVSSSGDKIILRTDRGKTKRFQRSLLSPEDIEYVELTNPPAFNVDFFQQSSQMIIKSPPDEYFTQFAPPKILNYVFGAKIKQISANSYNQELCIEFFAIGGEVWGNKLILLDRQQSYFTPNKENNRSHKFSSGRTVRLIEYEMYGASRGRKYFGNLVTVTDKRGEIIAYTTSNEWLFENLENLKELPINAYFDKTCTRTYPTPPKLYY